MPIYYKQKSVLVTQAASSLYQSAFHFNNKGDSASIFKPPGIPHVACVLIGSLQF